MADPLTLITTTIQLIDACVKKYKEFREFKDQCKTFRKALVNVMEVLKDIKKELAGDLTVFPELERPVKLVQTAVKEGEEVLKQCLSLTNMKAGLMSGQYMGELSKATGDIKEAMNLVILSGVTTQMKTLRKVESVLKRLEELDRKILAALDEQHEVQVLISRVMQLQMNNDRDGANKLINEGLVKMGVVSSRREFVKEFAEVRREAGNIRRARTVYDAEMIMAIRAVPAQRLGLERARRHTELNCLPDLDRRHLYIQGQVPPRKFVHMPPFASRPGAGYRT